MRARRARLATLGAILTLAALAEGCTGHRAPTTAPTSTQPQRGEASWYGSKFNGRRTASGERYDMRALTAAHPSLPFGTLVQVTNLDNGRQVVVRINDRGPFAHGRIIDVSYAAARELELVGSGTANVELAVVTADQIAPERVVPLPAVTAVIAGNNPAAEAPSAELSAALRALDQPLPTSPQDSAPSSASGTTAPPSSAALSGDIVLPPEPAPIPVVDLPAPPARSSESASREARANTAPSPRTRQPLGHLRYTVQVGAFSEAERASALRDELVARYPTAAVHSDGTWNRVQIGVFDDRTGAEDLCRELVTLGLTGLVVPAPER